MNKIAIAFVFLFLVFNSFLVAQTLRGLINDGVENYEKQKYSDAEVNFLKGLEKDPQRIEPYYNLGASFYKQQRFDEATEKYKAALTKTENELLKANTFYNIGNTLLKKEKYSESIEAYKNALKINPNDQMAKYNLSYSLEKLKQQQQQQNKDQNNKNDKKQDQKDQENQKDNQQDKNNQDEKKNDQQSDGNNQEKKQEQGKDQQQEQSENKISQEEAKRILNAIKNDESDLQKKLRQKRAKVYKVEKDW